MAQGINLVLAVLACIGIVAVIVKFSWNDAYKRGYDKGHSEGKVVGVLEGQIEGYLKGRKDGHNEGKELGFSQGRVTGIQEGFDGYSDFVAREREKNFEIERKEREARLQENIILNSKDKTGTAIVPDEFLIAYGVTSPWELPREVQIEFGFITEGGKIIGEETD